MNIPGVTTKPGGRYVGTAPEVIAKLKADGHNTDWYEGKVHPKAVIKPKNQAHTWQATTRFVDGKTMYFHGCVTCSPAHLKAFDWR